MTREEAIEIIRKEYLCVDRDCDIEKSCGKCDLMMPSKEPILQAYNMAISALEQDCDKCEYANPCLYCKHEFSLTSTDEPMTMVYPTIFCDDAISREALLEKMADYVASGYADSAEDFEEYSKIICQLPSVQPSHKGHWIKDEPTVTEPYVCSECGMFHNGKNRNVCPYCGAKME